MPHQSEIYNSPLYLFLMARFGDKDDKRLDIQSLAPRLGVHRYTIYRWLHEGLTIKGAKCLMRANKSITIGDILPFIPGL